jgi:hypothetical protein
MGPGHLYMYLLGEGDQWWKIQEHIATPVSLLSFEMTKLISLGRLVSGSKRLYRLVYGWWAIYGTSPFLALIQELTNSSFTTESHPASSHMDQSRNVNTLLLGLKWSKTRLVLRDVLRISRYMLPTAKRNISNISLHLLNI